MFYYRFTTNLPLSLYMPCMYISRRISTCYNLFSEDLKLMFQVTEVTSLTVNRGDPRFIALAGVIPCEYRNK